jgi:NAD(P)-dependent dehydrogenase (short-subunit alcohol dehydrogenase family)
MLSHVMIGADRPEDIAPMIAFLASAQASWIIDQAISVNGGFGRA